MASIECLYEAKSGTKCTEAAVGAVNAVPYCRRHLYQRMVSMTTLVLKNKKPVEMDITVSSDAEKALAS